MLLDFILDFSIFVGRDIDGSNNLASQYPKQTYACNGGYINYKNGDCLWVTKDVPGARKCLEKLGFKKLDYEIGVSGIDDIKMRWILLNYGPFMKETRMALAFNRVTKIKEELKKLETLEEYLDYVNNLLNENPYFKYSSEDFKKLIGPNGLPMEQYMNEWYQDLLTREEIIDKKNGIKR